MDKNTMWFRRKRFGWGWTPCTWQGWAILAMYLFVVAANTVFVEKHTHSNSDALMAFFPQTYILTVFLIIICYATGEKPRWQWGKQKEEENDKNKSRN